MVYCIRCGQHTAVYNLQMTATAQSPAVMLPRAQMLLPRQRSWASNILIMRTTKKTSTRKHQKGWLSRLRATFCVSCKPFWHTLLLYYVTDLGKLYIELKYRSRKIFPAIYVSVCECQTYFDNLYRKHSRWKSTKWHNVLIISWIKIGISLKYVPWRCYTDVKHVAFTDQVKKKIIKNANITRTRWNLPSVGLMSRLQFSRSPVNGNVGLTER